MGRGYGESRLGEEGIEAEWKALMSPKNGSKLQFPENDSYFMRPYCRMPMPCSLLKPVPHSPLNLSGLNSRASGPQNRSSKCSRGGVICTMVPGRTVTGPTSVLWSARPMRVSVRVGRRAEGRKEQLEQTVCVAVSGEASCLQVSCLQSEANRYL